MDGGWSQMAPWFRSEMRWHRGMPQRKPLNAERRAPFGERAGEREEALDHPWPVIA